MLPSRKMYKVTYHGAIFEKKYSNVGALKKATASSGAHQVACFPFGPADTEKSHLNVGTYDPLHFEKYRRNTRRISLWQPRKVSIEAVHGSTIVEIFNTPGSWMTRYRLKTVSTPLITIRFHM